MTKDQQLQLALAKMLPEHLHIDELNHEVYWKDGSPFARDWDETKFGEVLTTEWLHVCWLAEQQVIRSLAADRRYIHELCKLAEPANTIYTPARATACASWQQRAEALCKVKGIEL